MRAELAPLAARYDVVVANPPYMGGNNMNRWLNGWCKKNYPDTCRDLCTCFVGRGMDLASRGGYEALITSDTCMYISSFEKMRKMLIGQTTIVAFIDTRGTNAHPDVFDANAGWVLWLGRADGLKGSYFKLNHSIAEKEAGYLEALADPGCGWFYRRDASAFETIPGSPIAYWASEVFIRNCITGQTIDDFSIFSGSQNITADNAKYLRFAWEVNFKNCNDGQRWIPYAKGGEFRRWYGDIYNVVDWSESARLYYHNNGTSNLLNEPLWYREGITYTDITSGKAHFRFLPSGCVFDKAGPSIVGFTEHLLFSLGLFNSSVSQYYFDIFNPTIHLQARDVKAMPILLLDCDEDLISSLVSPCVQLSRRDWEQSETCLEFVRHPML